MNRDAEVFARSIAEATTKKRMPTTFEEYQTLSADEKRDIHDRARKSTKPMTFGDFVEQWEGIQETLLKHIGSLSSRIAELEKRPIPKFVSILRPEPESDE